MVRYIWCSPNYLFMQYQVCCIGHITLDKVVTPAKTVFMPGGTAYYFSHAIASFCSNYLLVTAIADNEMQSVKDLEARGIKVKRLSSKYTAFFENTYGANPDERQQRVLQQTDDFRLYDLQDLQTEIFHLGPLLANDISDDVIKALASKGKVSLDVQGLLRRVEDEKVIPVDWELKEDVLPHVHFLKANEEEMKVLTGLDEIEQSARQLADWGAKEIIITLGSKGSVIYHQNKFYHIAAYQPAEVIDATGCGDTYMAGYLHHRVNGTGIQEAGEFASAMAAAKIAAHGPFTGTKEDVDAVKLNGTVVK